MGVMGMRHYLLLLIFLTFFLGCVHEHQINIGQIALTERANKTLHQQEYYMSFTQEYYDNKLYPLNEYCDDQRTYLSDDKFSTETYLKISNERTKQSRVGKYPIWFLLNDDASNISCVKKSANFINEEPFVVNASDDLSINLLQKNEAMSSVPVQELGLLIDLVSLVVPRTANFLMKTNNIIQDPIAQNYLNLMDEAFKHGDLDGTKSRDFKPNVEAIRVKLYVPNADGEKKELGYILLKPKYRSTLTTVNTQNGIPNFRFIYNSDDPQIEDLMQYELKNRRVRIQVVVDNFKQVADEYVVEALASLNTQLSNRFTRFDRALILNIALRQSRLYRNFKLAINNKDLSRIEGYISYLEQKKNPLEDLKEELRVTKCEYYDLMQEGRAIIKTSKALHAQESANAQRIKEEALREQRAMQEIENFFTPVANWNYIDQMFAPNVSIRTTLGKVLEVSDLKDKYDHEDEVVAYGCYVDLSGSIASTNIQNYLIHPSYVNGEKYNYMALSLNEDDEIDVIFYKFSSEKHLKISKMFIDVGSRFISANRIKAVLGKAQNCSSRIKKFY